MTRLCLTRVVLVLTRLYNSVFIGDVGQYRFNHLLGSQSHIAFEVGTNLQNDRFNEIVLTSGDAGVHYNFCEHLPASLCGTVYHDVNNNGVQDTGEEGIANTVVQLFDG